jgi:hypothetical protein
MKLSNASNHISSVYRGGGGRSTHGMNAGTGKGMPKQDRSKTVHVGDRSADSTNMPMPMTLDDDTGNLTGYV